MGSVKDLEVLVPPEGDVTGTGRFRFSDRYSVFDWGEMPDLIPDKGASIALLSAYFFEKLEDSGMKTHYLGLVEDGGAKPLAELKGPSTTMEIRLLRVLKPEFADGAYDYSCYEGEKGNFLIPLEIIYRNSLPEGSSVFRRLSSGEVRPEDFGLDRMPVPGEELEEPILDVSTKLEVTDRYISWEEARRIAGLSEAEIEDIKGVALTVNRMITDEFSRIGLKNEDGKIELGFDPERRLMLVDVLGTLDECRFTYRGIPVSKEIARIYYRNTAWYGAVEEAKAADRMRWKELVREAPEPLPPRLRTLISQVYASCTNEITGREWFREIPPVEEILGEVKEFLSGRTAVA
ncbi:MAG TPA: phosphoribosylaminoimidazolesuccinocarboxamide synthase [Nitrospirae bacterium]|nr:phosphoribosylaminoimidazolesuccinocarboxamide synthase [Nitrospirota bacterium]